MPCTAQHMATTLFTEEDLAWDPASSTPPTHLDLRLVRLHEEDSSPDILADLEAVTPHVPVRQSGPLPDLSFDSSASQRDVLAAHILRRATTQQMKHGQQMHQVQDFSPVDWPSLPRFARRASQGKTELTSPTDIAWAGLLGGAATPTSSHSISALRGEPFTDVVEEELVLEGVKLDRQLVEGLKKRISKPRRSRKSATPQPSRFCHICARTQKSRKMFCANLSTDKKCRKAVCEPCFVELKWDFLKAMEGKGEWHCPHCRGICNSVPRARCHIYTKTNEKRKATKRS